MPTGFAAKRKCSAQKRAEQPCWTRTSGRSDDAKDSDSYAIATTHEGTRPGAHTRQIKTLTVPAPSRRHTFAKLLREEPAHARAPLGPKATDGGGWAGKSIPAASDGGGLPKQPRSFRGGDARDRSRPGCPSEKRRTTGRTRTHSGAFTATTHVNGPSRRAAVRYELVGEKGKETGAGAEVHPPPCKLAFELGYWQQGLEPCEQRARQKE